MKPSHAWVGGSSQRWNLSCFPALVFQHVVEIGTKYEEMGLDVLIPGDGLDWGSRFQIFVLSNPVLQKQGELSTFYQCGQQSLKYLLSGPFQKNKSLLTIAGGRKAE